MMTLVTATGGVTHESAVARHESGRILERDGLRMHKTEGLVSHRCVRGPKAQMEMVKS